LDRDLAPAVFTHAGYSGSDHPLSIRWEGCRMKVKRVIKEWREPGSKHYLVEAENSLFFKLVLLEPGGRWIISPVQFKSNS
jgi:hypothetical protein